MSTQPNPKSTILANAIIGGAGIGLPPEQSAPRGMGCVLLYTPVGGIIGKSIIEIQQDVGLPWCMGNDGAGFWFEGEPAAATNTDDAVEATKLRHALENVRLLASRHSREEWAQHMLRFCSDAGVKANPLR
jgi:hypothetical protein